MPPDKREEEMHQKIVKFLRSRHQPATKQYVWKIIERLEQERIKNIQDNVKKSEIGWVRVRTLLDDLVGKGDGKIENATTFYRLLHDLSGERLIDKRVLKMAKEKGPKATFYRTLFDYQERWFYSRELLEKSIDEYEVYIRDLFEQFMIAQDLLTEMGCVNPHEIIIERFTRLRKREPFYIVRRDPNLDHEFMEQITQIPDQETPKRSRIYGPKKVEALI
ncbi:MAG: hypothetical protein ABSB80_03450 [Methanoregula sp.]|jgi:hypothetical protein|uniref:hypothetical protein n=1 Tax=Methanoregula sp. TaxID=2052170 RepID=UPI003D0BB3BA